MKLSFIIPLYNCLPLTQAMLASLRETLPPDVDGEIILVDDGSTDGTRAWLKNLPAPCRTLLQERNSGFAAACNRGAAAATGEILFFLNNDLILRPRWLEPMLAAFTRFPSAGLVGNVQLNAATGAVDHTGIFFNLQGKPTHDHARPLSARLTGYREVTALTGACCAIRRTVWQQFGGFDEGFINGSEDIDLCLRARAAGLRHYIAMRSVVRHHISASAGRKLRDEENSRRLLVRWRATIGPLTRRLSYAACLAAAWEEPRNYPDEALARDAFLHLLFRLPRPTGRLQAVIEVAIEVELARWAHLFEGAPPHPARQLAWQFFPAPPPPQPPVL